MNAYEVMRKRHAEEINSIPMIFLFGKKDEEELHKRIKELGAESVNDLCYIGSGGYIHKKNKARLLEMMNKHEQERKAHLLGTNYAYFYDMFRTEMANHEYGYTQDLQDTLDACGVTAKDFEKNPIMQKALVKASTDCIVAFNECN